MLVDYPQKGCFASHAICSYTICSRLLLKSVLLILLKDLDSLFLLCLIRWQNGHNVAYTVTSVHRLQALIKSWMSVSILTDF